MKSKTTYLASLCTGAALALNMANAALAAPADAAPPAAVHDSGHERGHERGQDGCSDGMGPPSIHHADLRLDRAEGPGMPPAMFAGLGPLPPYLRGLSLSDDQQDRIFSILHEQAPRMRLQVRAAHKAREQLRQLATAEKYDENQAKSLAEAGGKAESEIALMRAQADHDIAALLTPYQRNEAFSPKCVPTKY